MTLSMITNLRSVFERADIKFKLHHYRVKEFRAKVHFAFTRGHYQVRTAENGEDLKSCLKLRFDVFHKEFMKKRRTQGVDVDLLDYDCDHLMVVDQRSGQVIGTYRLNSSSFSNSCYSQNEFHMEKILALQGPRLELGRACIDISHRSGVIIALLWRGIAAYIRTTETRVLFGCSSIKTIEPLEIAVVTQHLRDSGFLTYEYGVKPTAKYTARQLPRALAYLDENPYAPRPVDPEDLIPPLFRSYLKMGAKLCGEPALDRDFYCIDFLTLIGVEAFTSTIKQRYSLEAGTQI